MTRSGIKPKTMGSKMDKSKQNTNHNKWMKRHPRKKQDVYKPMIGNSSTVIWMIRTVKFPHTKIINQ